MTFIARIFRYLFWLLVVSWSVSILRRIVNGMDNRAQGPKPYVDVPNDAISQRLVRDPVCGMHIAEGIALPLQQAGALVHFCSAECRDKYVSGTRKYAANA